ncbi:MAG: type III pantothenate kinase [Candidatus Omnitrophica bacterium]|nr:type III pantothenate kinase [Candidatus Omnitrophota bacterium]
MKSVKLKEREKDLKVTYILAIDIGNTNITAGIFVGNRLVHKAKIATHKPALYLGLLKRFLGKVFIRPDELDGVIVASVVPNASSALLKALKAMGVKNVLVTGRDVRIPVKNLYRKRSEVGQDRLVNAYAARKLYGSPAVVVDFGTAVTFDIVSKKGEYMGGLIMPGVGISLETLYERTALLPKVELKDAPSIIAKDTVSSMRGGILFGFGAMCDGLIARYRKILGSNLTVIATGGNCHLIKKYASSISIVDEDLTLKGLYHLV